MDFSLHSDSDGTFMSNYELIEKNSGEPMTDRLKFIFLELPNVQSITEDSPDLAKLCYALHNMTTLKSRPQVMQAEIFELLFNSAEITKFTPQEKIRYENDMTTERDIRNQIAYSKEEGLKEGLEQGRQALILTARKLVVEIGLSAEQAAKATGLSPDEFMKN